MAGFVAGGNRHRDASDKGRVGAVAEEAHAAAGSHVLCGLGLLKFECGAPTGNNGGLQIEAWVHAEPGAQGGFGRKRVGHPQDTRHRGDFGEIAAPGGGKRGAG